MGVAGRELIPDPVNGPRGELSPPPIGIGTLSAAPGSDMVAEDGDCMSEGVWGVAGDCTGRDSEGEKGGRGMGCVELDMEKTPAGVEGCGGPGG